MVLLIVLGVLLFVLRFWKVVWNLGNLEGSCSEGFGEFSGFIDRFQVLLIGFWFH